MDHECKYGTKIDDLDKTVFGNGKPGLKENVIVLIESLKTMNCHISDLKTGISGINKFIDEERGKQKAFATTKWLIGMNITLLLALISLIIKTAV